MIFLGADHAGFQTKQAIKVKLLEIKKSFIDLGTNSEKPLVDYPDYAQLVAEKVKEKAQNQGILICGSGTGMCIAANKIKGIRASVAWDEYTAQKSREDNNANILCLSGRDTPIKEAVKIAEIWLNSIFSEKERYQKRLNKIKKIEESRN